MPDFISLTCPSCGSKLQITEGIERFTCSSCGNEHIIKRGGGIVSIAPVVEGLKEVKSGVDKTASELAIARLKDEIRELKAEREELKPDLKNIRLGMIFFAILGLIFICLSGSIGYANNTPLVGLNIMTLVSIIGFGIFLFLFLNKKSNYKKDIQQINKAISEHEKELRKYQDFIKGQ